MKPELIIEKLKGYCSFKEYESNEKAKEQETFFLQHHYKARAEVYAEISQLIRIYERSNYEEIPKQ